MSKDALKSNHELHTLLTRFLGGGLALLIFIAIAMNLTGFEIPSELFYVIGLWGFGFCAYAVIRNHLLVYVSKRLLEAIVTLWVIATFTFLLLRFLPGGPFDQEKALPPEVKANIEAKYGLNDPLPKQYVDYIFGLARGDLGQSFKYVGRSVTEIISETFPASFQLGFYAMFVAFMIGIPLGIFAASQHNKVGDTAAMLLAISGVALPSFMVGPLLVLIFSFGVPFEAFRGLLPPALWEGPIFYILPVVTLGIRPSAIIARLTRSSVLEVIQSDFVRTAKAKGLPRKLVLFKHVLRNSLIPVLSYAGPMVAGLLSGSFVIEVIFAIPGMAKHLVQSVTNRDYPLILGVTFVYAALLVLANLITDILYTFVDPRIKLS